MDARRGATAVPKVRQVGFFTPNAPPSRSQPGPPVANSPRLSDSRASNSLSPVMIPHSSRIGDGEFSEESSPGWFPRSNSAKFASSFPSGGFDLTSLKPSQRPEIEAEKSVKAPGANGEEGAEMQNERLSNSKPLKAKTTKAERRALQESQRAAKAAAKGAGNKSSGVSKGAITGKPLKQQPPQTKETAPAAPSIAGSERKSGDRLPEKQRRKDVPPPRMQFDGKKRVEKTKRRALVN